MAKAKSQPTFGQTWWGKAWLKALEDGAMADSARLSRGRSYARQGKVFVTELLPGLVSARVIGKEEYSTDLSIRLLSDEQWEVVNDTMAERARYAAALNAGQLPSALESELDSLGVSLLPRVGDLLGDCSCPDWGEPCKHVAGLCYLVCGLIDLDPFTLLQLRGRSRNDIVESLRRRRQRASGGQPAAPEAVGVDARAAFDRNLAPLPNSISAASLGSAGRAKGRLRHLTAPPLDAGLDTAELAKLAADASLRARRIVFGDGDSGLSLSVTADAARRIAANPSDTEQLQQLQENLGLPAEELAGLAIAWRHGGPQGVAISSLSWQPPKATAAQGLKALGEGSRLSANRVSGKTRAGEGVQLRIDRQHRWWRFEPHDSLGWVLASSGFDQAGDALDLPS